MDKEDVVYGYNGIYYSAIKKKNEILPFVTMKMDSEDIMLSEMGQTETGKLPYDLT